MEEEAKALNTLVEARQQARIKEDAGIAAFMATQQEAAHKSLQTIADRVQGLQDEAAAVALSREQNVSLAVAVVPMASWVCPGGVPLAEVDGVTLRPDGVHVADEGAALLWERQLAPFVRTVVPVP